MLIGRPATSTPSMYSGLIFNEVERVAPVNGLSPSETNLNSIDRVLEFVAFVAGRNDVIRRSLLDGGILMILLVAIWHNLIHEKSNELVTLLQKTYLLSEVNVNEVALRILRLVKKNSVPGTKAFGTHRNLFLPETFTVRLLMLYLGVWMEYLPVLAVSFIGVCGSSSEQFSNKSYLCIFSQI